MKLMTLFKTAFVASSIALLSGCGTMNAMGNLNDGASDTFFEVWDKWVEAEGDIAEATMWEMKVEEGVEFVDVVDAINNAAMGTGLMNVGELPLSEELKARGVDSKRIHVMSFCNPETARTMIDFSPAMGGFLPCRITIIEEEDGLHLYSMNMDMMVKMGKELPSPLKEEAMKVRDTVWTMMEKGAAGAW